MLSNFFRFDILFEFWPQIASGMWVTVKLALAVVVMGIFVGLLIALIRIAGMKVVNLFILIFSDIFRTLPPLVVVIILYFGMPLADISISGFASVWIALAVKLAAFAQEIFYSSLLSVNRGQMDAAEASGLTFWQGIRYILLPQAIRLSIPPITNRTIGTTKGTAIGSVVAVPDILAQAMDVQALVYNTTPLTMAAIGYMIIFFPLVVASRYLEKRYAVSNNK